MRAIRTSGAPSTLDTLRLVDMDEAPAPGPGEIRVVLKASSLNYHDFAVVTGMIPTPEGRIVMSDGAGVIDAVGTDVSEFEIGDNVVSTFFPEWLDGEPMQSALTDVPGDGIDGYAREAVTVPATWFTRAPVGFSHAEAATLTCAGLTAWRALFVENTLKPGDTVLVQGTGGVSVFALQFAKMAGAKVIATSSSDEKLERVKAMGADHVINYKEVEAWGQKALEMTDGRGVDCVIEVGGAGTLNQSMLAARVSGHIALIGVLTGITGPVHTALLFQKNLRVHGLTVGSRKQQIDMIAAIEANAIKPIISDEFALADLANAFRHQENGQHFGKIAINI